MAIIASGQITATTSPQPISSTAIGCNKWVFKALSSNTSQVAIGPLTQIGGATLSATNGHLMDPGDYFEIDNTIQAGAVYLAHPSDVYIVWNGTGTAPVVSWAAFG